MSKTTTPIRATTTIPWIPRLLLTTLEPFFAICGVFQILINPHFYAATFTRSDPSTLHPASQGNTWVYTQLAGGWLLVAFLEAVVLRLVDDLRVWRLVCAGMLLSDVCYVHGSAQAVGGWGEHMDVKVWTALDWVAQVTTWPFVLVRVGIALGLLGNGKVKRL